MKLREASFVISIFVGSTALGNAAEQNVDRFVAKAGTVAKYEQKSISQSKTGPVVTNFSMVMTTSKSDFVKGIVIAEASGFIVNEVPQPSRANTVTITQDYFLLVEQNTKSTDNEGKLLRRNSTLNCGEEVLKDFINYLRKEALLECTIVSKDERSTQKEEIKLAVSVERDLPLATLAGDFKVSAYYQGYILNDFRSETRSFIDVSTGVLVRRTAKGYNPARELVFETEINLVSLNRN